MELFFICRVFGFGSSFEESDAVVSAVRCFSFLTFPDFPFHSVSSFSFWHYVRLCHYAALISALQVVLKTRLVDSLSAVSPNRGLQALTLTAKEQRQSNGTKQYRNPEDWECSGRPQFKWIPMNSILHSALNLGCFSAPLSVRYAHTTSHCPVQISQPERLICHCTMLHATYTTAMSRRDLAHNLITTLQNKQKEKTRKKYKEAEGGRRWQKVPLVPR